MPLYEYLCESCGDRFEIIQRFSDEPLQTHEKCGGPVHRLISTSALQFKGSGWYITDYAKSGKSDNGGSKSDETKPSGDSKGASSDSSKSETKTGSKPAESKPASTTPEK